MSEIRDRRVSWKERLSQSFRTKNVDAVGATLREIKDEDEDFFRFVMQYPMAVLVPQYGLKDEDWENLQFGSRVSPKVNFLELRGSIELEISLRKLFITEFGVDKYYESGSGFAVLNSNDPIQMIEFLHSIDFDFSRKTRTGMTVGESILQIYAPTSTASYVMQILAALVETGYDVASLSRREESLIDVVVSHWARFDEPAQLADQLHEVYGLMSARHYDQNEWIMKFETSSRAPRVMFDYSTSYPDEVHEVPFLFWYVSAVAYVHSPQNRYVADIQKAYDKGFDFSVKSKRGETLLQYMVKRRVMLPATLQVFLQNNIPFDAKDILVRLLNEYLRGLQGLRIRMSVFFPLHEDVECIGNLLDRISSESQEVNRVLSEIHQTYHDPNRYDTGLREVGATRMREIHLEYVRILSKFFDRGYPLPLSGGWKLRIKN